VRLVGEERSPEYADAEVDGFLERQLFPLTEQGFLRTQRLRTAFEQGFNRALDLGIEAAFRGDHVDQPPGKGSDCVDVLGRHHQPTGAAPADQPRQQCRMDDRGNADFDLGHPEFRVVRGDPEIAGGCDLEAAAEAPARHPRDHRRGKRAHGLAKIAQARNEFLGGGLIQLCHFLDIGAADHALFALPGDDQHANLPVRREHL
jgi:hypothetical protein